MDVRPESPFDHGCDAKTLTAETAGTTLTCSATSDGGTTTVSKTIKIDKTPRSSPRRPPRPTRRAGTTTSSRSPLLEATTCPGSTRARVLRTAARTAPTPPFRALAGQGGTREREVRCSSNTTRRRRRTPGAPRATRTNGWHKHRSPSSSPAPTPCPASTPARPTSPTVAPTRQAQHHRLLHTTRPATRAAPRPTPSSTTPPRRRSCPSPCPTRTKRLAQAPLTVSSPAADATSASPPAPSPALQRPRHDRRRSPAPAPTRPATRAAQDLHGQVRRDGADARTAALSWIRRERLVQPRADGQLPRHRRDLSDRRLHAAGYSGPDNSTATVKAPVPTKPATRPQRRSGSNTTPPRRRSCPTPCPTRTPSAGTRHRWRSSSPAADATSGINACTPTSPTAAPTRPGTPITGSCTDKAGNPQRPQDLHGPVRRHRPGARPDPVPDPNALGWHKAPLTRQVPRYRRHLRDRHLHGRPALQRPRHAPTPRSPAPAPTRPATRAAPRPTRSSTTPPRRRSSPDPVPDPNQHGWHKAPLSGQVPRQRRHVTDRRAARPTSPTTAPTRPASRSPAPAPTRPATPAARRPTRSSTTPPRRRLPLALALAQPARLAQGPADRHLRRHRRHVRTGPTVLHDPGLRRP